ncbi:Ankyrin repeat-containing domain [Phytophthora cactorum]|nr:Ankyrin repeat-containing domain [Phytophthora cactorum]
MTLDFLREVARLSPEVVFLNAAVHGHSKLMQSTYDVKRISPETILAAFTKNSTKHYHEILGHLLQYLCVNPDVPQAMRHTAFIYAAKRRWVWALELLDQSEHGDWPLVLLKKALVAANDDKPGNYTRKNICKQLFNRKSSDPVADQVAKRPCTSTASGADDQLRSRYPRLKSVRFPSAILALPHVLDYIDSLLMTPSEALTEAAKEGQVERAAQLFKQYNCGVSGALVAAATNGHLEIMKLLPFKAPCSNIIAKVSEAKTPGI